MWSRGSDHGSQNARRLRVRHSRNRDTLEDAAVDGGDEQVGVSKNTVRIGNKLDVPKPAVTVVSKWFGGSCSTVRYWKPDDSGTRPRGPECAAGVLVNMPAFPIIHACARCYASTALAAGKPSIPIGQTHRKGRESVVFFFRTGKIDEGEFRCARDRVVGDLASERSTPVGKGRFVVVAAAGELTACSATFDQRATFRCSSDEYVTRRSTGCRMAPEELRGWLEFTCWTTLALAPFLYSVNWPAASTDQFVARTALVILAACGAIDFRLFASLQKRSRHR